MVTTHGSGGDRPPEPEFLNVARVLRPWGVRGELKLRLVSSIEQVLETALTPGEAPPAHDKDRWHLRLSN